jgi:hypothetical protein
MRINRTFIASLLTFVLSLTNVAAPANAMQVYIHVIGGYNWVIDVEPFDTIEDIKQKVYDRSGYSPSIQNIIFMNKTLQDGRSLSDYNIQRESTLNVVLTTFGSPPTLNFSSAGAILPGENVSFFIANSKKDCQATVYWSGINEVIDPVTATVKNSGKTAAMTLITPSIAGTYTLRTSSFYYSCSGGHIAGLSRSITVGKSVSIVAKLSTSSGYVAKSPIISVSGNLRSGSLAVPAKAVSISLMLGDVEVQTIPATTNSLGVFSASFAGISYAPGAYTAVVSTESDSTYIAKSKSSAILKLR